MSASLQDFQRTSSNPSEAEITQVVTDELTSSGVLEPSPIAAYDPSQSRLKLLIQQSPLALVEWDTSLRITAWNPAAEQIFGYSCNEILGQHFNVIIPQAFHSYIEEVAQKMLSQTGSTQIINENLTKAGELIICEWFSVPLIGPAGEVLGGVSMAMNITDRKKAEDALRGSQSQLENLTNNLPGLVYKFKLDLNGNASFPFISKRSWDLFELQPEDIRSDASGVIQQINSEDLEHFYQRIAHSIQTLTPFYWLGRFQTLSGTQKWIEARSVPERQSDGSTIWDGVMLDVTDRKLAEAALSESEKRFRDVSEAAGEYIWEIDSNAVYTYLTGKSTQVKGYSPEELLGRSPVEFMPPEDIDPVGQILAEASAQKKSFTLQHRDILPNGAIVWEEVSGVPLFGQSGEIIGFRGTGLSITDRKRAEEEIQQKNQDLEQALRKLQQSQAQVVQAEKMSALGNLVAGVAHEINNPIGFLNGSIKNAQEYLQDLLNHLALYQQHYPNAALPIQDHAEEIDLEFLVEDFTKLVNSMKGATDRIKAISTGLRTFSRADAEHKIEANLQDGIESTLLILKYRLKANEFRPAIEVITDYGTLPKIACFPGQLNQVFMNLLANAIDVFDEVAQTSSFEQLKANPQKITIKTSLIADQQVEIRIRDNGSGMTEEVRARVFDHLFTTKSAGKGTGLGLTIAHEIITKIHQGQIEVISAIEKGTEFIVTLPI